jgi:filamentous hemagglutinin
MNTRCYRVIFNKTLGVMTAVSEIAKSHSCGKSVGTSRLMTAWPRLPMKIIAISLALQLSGIQVVYAEIVSDQHAGANKPVVIQTQNHIEQVQIVAPDSHGVSHNQYQEFNVDHQGAILNNSKTPVVTQQGGAIAGNQNLHDSGSAKVIVNEVTSTHSSTLNGYLEVAGQKADVVVSNPNGIRVNGFGFINTNRGTLTTGKPVVTENGLQSLQVTKGQISIEGKGFDDKETSQADIIARSVVVNAKIQANNLKVLTGSNQVDYSNLDVKVIRGKDNQPTVAIDVAALGGMYANSIMLVGTEKGVGVKSSGNIESSSDFTLSANGKITLAGQSDNKHSGHIYAHNNINISSGGNDLLLDHTQVVAGQDTHVDANGTINNKDGSITAGKDLSIVGKNVNNTDQALLNSQGNTNITVNDKVSNTGRIYGNDITIEATNVENGKSKRNDQEKKAIIAARNNLIVGAKEIVNQEGATLQSEGDMLLAGSTDGKTASEKILNSSAQIDAGNDLKTNTNRLDNLNVHFKTQVTEDSSDHVIEYKVTEDGTVLVDGKDAHVEDDGHHQYLLINAGLLTADEAMTADADGFKHHGFLKLETYQLNKWFMSVDKDGKLTEVDRRNIYNIYEYDKVKSSTKILDSAPSVIQAGGNVTLSGNVTNDKSQIVAGGDVSGQLGEINNIDAKGVHITEYKGKETIHSVKICAAYTKVCNDTKDQALPYETERDPNNLDIASIKTNVDSLKKSKNNIGQDELASAMQLAQSQLFHLNQDKKLPYLIETDPAYTNMQKFMSSDYMLGKLGLSGITHLGDGYYEQKLIKQAYFQKTGQHLDNSQNIDDAYKQLMDDGLLQGAKLHLVAGQALTVEQQAQLEDNMVWMVEKETVLPNGQKIKVMTPELYLVNSHPTNNVPMQATISGHNIDITAQQVNNNATMSAVNNLALHAHEINNKKGSLVAGNELNLQAKNDIQNHSGEIAGEHVNIHADGNVVIDTTTTQFEDSHGKQQTLDSTGNVSGNTVVITAAKDVHVNGAEIVSAGDMQLHADHNLDLGTVTSKNQKYLDSKVINKDGYIVKGGIDDRKSEIQNGSVIQSGHDVKMTAGHDINTQAADIKAANSVDVDAVHDANIGDAHHVLDAYTTSTVVDKGVLGNTITDEVHSEHRVQSEGSNVLGDNVTIHAGHDINVTGSSVQSNTQSDIDAGHDVKLQAGTSTDNRMDSVRVQESGIMMNGDKILIGSSDAKNDNSIEATNQSGSMAKILSNGNVAIHAHNNVSGEGVNVSAGKDAVIDANQVSFKGAKDTSKETSETSQNKTGIYAGVDGVAIEIPTLIANAIDAKHKNKSKLSNLYMADAAAKTANIVYKLAQKKQVDLIAAHVGLGFDNQQHHGETFDTHEEGDVIHAGNNVQITASGNQKKPGSGDIKGVGTQISANSVTLNAKNNIDFQSAKDTETMHSKDAGSSWSLGVAYGLGKGKSGFAPEGKAGENSTDIDSGFVHNHNAHITAKETLHVASGGDTTLTGANLKGKKVDMHVGGNLHVESLQDTESYHQKNRGKSIETSIDIQHQDIDSEYAAVKEQSGIAAGKDGFHIDVTKNTDLKGAVISSRAPENKNELSTGTLTTSTITNTSTYKVTDHSSSWTPDFANPLSMLTQVAVNVFGKGKQPSGDKSSNTHSAISQAQITIRDEKAQKAKTGTDVKETIASINHDTKGANETLENQFNLESVQDQLQENQLKKDAIAQVSEPVYDKVGDLLMSNSWLTKGMSEKQRLVTKVAVHSAVGGVISKLSGGDFVHGAIGAGAAKLAVEEFGESLKKIPGLEEIYGEQTPEVMQKNAEREQARDELIKVMGMTVAKLSASALGGNGVESNTAATTAKLATEFNYLNHAEAEALEKANDQCLSGNADACSTADRLYKLHKERERKVLACDGDNSSHCNALRQEEREYVADAIRHGDDDSIYAELKQYTENGSYSRTTGAQLARQIIEESKDTARRDYSNFEEAKGFAIGAGISVSDTVSAFASMVSPLPYIVSSAQVVSELGDYLKDPFSNKNLAKYESWINAVSVPNIKQVFYDGTLNLLHGGIDGIKEYAQKNLDTESDIYLTGSEELYGGYVGERTTDVATLFIPFGGEVSGLGKVGKVAGEVGKVAGEVGKVAGEVGKVTEEVGKVTEEVGKVTGEVGKVTGEVGKVAAGGEKASAAIALHPDLVQNAEHILKGEINKGGKAVGGHSLNDNVKLLSKGRVDADGVYEATIAIKDPATNTWVTKLKKHTMFPDNWSNSKILEEVNSAIGGSKYQVLGDTWSGITKSGIKVQGYIGPKFTAYPVLNLKGLP